MSPKLMIILHNKKSFNSATDMTLLLFVLICPILKNSVLNFITYNSKEELDGFAGDYFDGTVYLLMYALGGV